MQVDVNHLFATIGRLTIQAEILQEQITALQSQVDVQTEALKRQAEKLASNQEN